MKPSQIQSKKPTEEGRGKENAKKQVKQDFGHQQCRRMSHRDGTKEEPSPVIGPGYGSKKRGNPRQSLSWKKFPISATVATCGHAVPAVTDSPSGIMSESHAFLLQLLLVMAFYLSDRKVTNTDSKRPRYVYLDVSLVLPSPEVQMSLSYHQSSSRSQNNYSEAYINSKLYGLWFQLLAR
ncbi:hypothetical protein STEG23_002442 [Scotinomys teguina]